jgi:hypothetical protein
VLPLVQPRLRARFEPLAPGMTDDVSTEVESFVEQQPNPAVSPRPAPPAPVYPRPAPPPLSLPMGETSTDAVEGQRVITQVQQIEQVIERFEQRTLVTSRRESTSPLSPVERVRESVQPAPYPPTTGEPASAPALPLVNPAPDREEPLPWTARPQILPAQDREERTRALLPIQPALPAQDMAESPAPPAIQVTIGRLEVRVAAAAPAPTPNRSARAPQSSQSLEEYLRKGGRR